jgi:hypothetical protein
MFSKSSKSRRTKMIMAAVASLCCMSCAPEPRTLTLQEATGCALEDTECLEALDTAAGE